MVRCFAIALALTTAACSATSDTRPETADYVIQAILVPACGRGGCHTEDTQPHGLAFDTIANAKTALATRDRGRQMVIAGDPDNSELVTVLVDTRSPMPPDQPLADADIDLIARWIAAGADGL
jgi:cytochrome c551/c552|nr:c-type cytochrome domain-containing protein [Kofleriaceae bacterium]